MTTGTFSSIIAVGAPRSSLELNRLLAPLGLLLVRINVTGLLDLARWSWSDRQRGVQPGASCDRLLDIVGIFTKTLNDSAESRQLYVLRVICCNGDLSVVFKTSFCHT